MNVEMLFDLHDVVRFDLCCQGSRCVGDEALMKVLPDFLLFEKRIHAREWIGRLHGFKLPRRSTPDNAWFLRSDVGLALLLVSWSGRSPNLRLWLHGEADQFNGSGG